MPNRILKESICTSDTLDKLTAFQETVFYRLIVQCDDFGRMDARPKILAAKLFPLKDVRVDQIKEALLALSSAELVILYQVDGKPFLQMKTWERHQQIRAKKSKYPAPDGSFTSSDIICNRMISDDSKCPRNPIQSNPIVVVTRAREDDGDELIKTAKQLDEVYEAAASIGLVKTMDCQKADLLAADYTAEWVLEAIHRASNGPKDAWCWRYIEGILRSWKKSGGMDQQEQPKPKTRKEKYIAMVRGEEVEFEREVKA